MIANRCSQGELGELVEREAVNQPVGLRESAAIRRFSQRLTAMRTITMAAIFRTVTNAPLAGLGDFDMPRRTTLLRNGLAALGLCAALGLTGCQSDFGGQTLPSPSYLLDDVQYFAPGPEFKLTREAAAMKAYTTDQDLGVAPPPGPGLP
jgi:hypothetical protein